MMANVGWFGQLLLLFKNYFFHSLRRFFLIWQKVTKAPKQNTSVSGGSANHNTAAGPPWTPWGCTSHSLARHCPACCTSGGWVCWGGWRRTPPTAGSGGGSMSTPTLRGELQQRSWLGPLPPTGTMWNLEIESVAQCEWNLMSRLKAI